MSSYCTLKSTWVKQSRYGLSKSYKKENFGAFSIRAAVRPPYSRDMLQNEKRRRENYINRDHFIGHSRAYAKYAKYLY
jgi:hypothetical protein